MLLYLATWISSSRTIAFSSAPAISVIYLKEDNIYFLWLFSFCFVFCFVLHIYNKCKAANCLWRNHVSWWLKWWVNWSRGHCQLNLISDIMMYDDDVCTKRLEKDPFETSRADERYLKRCWQHNSVSREFVRNLKVRPIDK